ncbi:MAG: hypothetical protein JO056_08920 [Alphaproteobacteria bacterium]|nr:hypothetical protein [Alphaproteobacteria bacterium]
MIANRVKLVIWDLDDTFWEGSLEEGGITAVPANIETVRQLALRGIISSICSKNDFERSKAKLVELDIWDHFVFPIISFDPKGWAVAEMIAGAGLRAENVLFIDDNTLNLEEVKFFNPGIMAAHPADVLHVLLAHPHLAGKPDPELSRLNQYRFLQRKVEERETTALSNEEFLRASNIRITFDYDVAGNFDRVVELINRTNQLNYTKKRLETPEELDEFRQQLERFGYHAGCIRAADKYGDYGLIGFFLLRRRSHIKRLVHFVFSCRTMHMGIEQYVYEKLGRPDIDISPPVSYSPDTHSRIDWIGDGDGESGWDSGVGSQKLLLLGGCDLLQLTAYCSTNRVEFVNRNEGKFRIRYDDPGFVLSDREAIRANNVIRNIPGWTYADALAFDKALADSELIMISLWSGMNGTYHDVTGELQVRLADPDARRIRKRDPGWFDANFREARMTDPERIKLVLRSFDAIRERAGNGMIFLIGSCTLGAEKQKQADRRRAYNVACRKYCAEHSARFRYVDVDAIVPPETVIRNFHFNRAGYHALARYIRAAADRGFMGKVANDDRAGSAALSTRRGEMPFRASREKFELLDYQP